MDWPEFALLLTGWLLGVLSNLIINWVSWHLKIRRFKEALLVELTELQFILVCLCFNLTSRYGQLDAAFVQWNMTMVRSYDGPNFDPEEAKRLAELKNLTDGQFTIWQNEARKKATYTGISLKKYQTPYLSSQIHMVSGLPSKLQKQMIWTLARLEMLREETDLANANFERTFDPSISEENYEIVDHNLKNGYRKVAGMAKDLANGITATKDLFR